MKPTATVALEEEIKKTKKKGKKNNKTIEE